MTPKHYRSLRVVWGGVVVCGLVLLCWPAVTRAYVKPESALGESPTAVPAQPEVSRILVSRGRADRLIAAMNQEDYEAAALVARERIKSPLSPEDAIGGYRTLLSVMLIQGRTQEALGEAQAAQAYLDANPAQRKVNPRLVASLLAGCAQVYEKAGKAREAIALYDEAKATGGLSEHVSRIATLNAAVLHVRVGEHAEAVRRVDVYLASEEGKRLEPNRVLSLRCQQVMWLAVGKDLAGAKARGDEVLVRHEGVDHPSLAEVAVTLARHTPVGLACAERRERAAKALKMVSRLEHLDMGEFDLTEGYIKDLREQIVLINRETEMFCPE